MTGGAHKRNSSEPQKVRAEMKVHALSCRSTEKDTGRGLGTSDVTLLSRVCRLSRILKLGARAGEGRDFQDEGVKDKQSWILSKVVKCRFF